jgi:cytochrome P450
MVYRSTIGSEGQVLVIDGRTVNIPPKTFVIPNIMAANTLPEFWGDDHMEWRPDRWINTNPASGVDTLCDPPNGKDTFFPFASGPRGCIGKRFAIVEYVAIISTLLRDYEVHVVPHEKESLECARERCRAAVVDGSEQSLVVHMTDPSAVPLRLVSRR